MALHITQSPYIAVITRRALIDDGFGGWAEDPAGATTTVNITGRMAKESRMVQAVQAMSAGLDTAASMYFLAPWDSGLIEGDQFPGWRVGRVTPLTKFGGVQALEGALYPA
jgi:hypothetical protein